MCLSCSQNAHGETVLAWDQSASRCALDWAGEKERAVEDQADHPPVKRNELAWKVTHIFVIGRRSRTTTSAIPQWE